MDTKRLDRLREAMRARAETMRGLRTDAAEARDHAEGIIARARVTRAIAATTLVRAKSPRGGRGAGR
jgi:hypothetical protein